jgi:hypothetical protein
MAYTPKQLALRQCHAIAAAIPQRTNKRLAILAWCRAAKKYLAA